MTVISFNDNELDEIPDKNCIQKNKKDISKFLNEFQENINS